MILRLRDRVPAGAAGECFYPELTYYADSTQCPFRPVVLQLHVKDTGHSAKSAGGRLHLNMRTPLSGLTMLFRHSAGTYQGNELTRNLSGNIQPKSSQLAEPLWTDPGLKSGIGMCGLSDLH